MESSEITAQIAKNLREVHFGGNWTGANLKDKLADVSWQQANQQVGELHSIATLVTHMDYYIAATLRALQGGALEASDEFSFQGPTIETAADWERRLDRTWANANQLADLIEQLPDSRLTQDFFESRNGTYYRCLQGLVEHCYYHVGQISLIKTMLQKQS